MNSVFVLANKAALMNYWFAPQQQLRFWLSYAATKPGMLVSARTNYTWSVRSDANLIASIFTRFRDSLEILFYSTVMCSLW